MSKKIRPSLKDYLRTGEVRAEVVESQEEPPQEAAARVSRSTKQNKVASRSKQTEKNNKTDKRTQQTRERSPARKKEPVQSAPPETDESSIVSENPSPPRLSAADFLLDSLTEADRETWAPILHAGSEITELPLDYVAVREDFRIMDRNRFTCYILDRKGDSLRPVRTSVQIREPLELLLKWDELGALTLFRPVPPSTRISTAI